MVGLIEERPQCPTPLFARSELRAGPPLISKPLICKLGEVGSESIKPPSINRRFHTETPSRGCLRYPRFGATSPAGEEEAQPASKVYQRSGRRSGACIREHTGQA